MAIERLKTTQKAEGKQTPSIPIGKPKDEPKPADKIYSMAELISKKRSTIERIAKAKGIEKAHLLKNKDEVAVAIISNQGDNPAEGELNLKQERFCQLYTSEFFGNGTQAYIEAYSISLAAPGAYQSSMTSAARLLRNAKVIARINELLQGLKLDDDTADAQIAFWAVQKENPMASIAAIREYNKLKKRVDERGLVGAGNTFIINQQNNEIHFTNPKARKIVENFDKWLLENTVAPQPEKADASNLTEPQPAQVVQ